MKRTIDLGHQIIELFTMSIPMMILTEEEENRFQNAVNCECCSKSFEKFGVYKIKDHCHFTGRFRSVLCASRNFEMVTPSFVPIYFHNLSYDSHFIVRELRRDNGIINVIPNSSQKYISFSS